MNSVDRVYSALKLLEPDRVPIIELDIAPQISRKICPY